MISPSNQGHEAVKIPDHIAIEARAEKGQLFLMLNLCAGVCLFGLVVLWLGGCVEQRTQPVPEQYTDPASDDRSFVADAGWWIPPTINETGACGCTCEEVA